MLLLHIITISQHDAALSRPGLLSSAVVLSISGRNGIISHHPMCRGWEMSLFLAILDIPKTNISLGDEISYPQRWNIISPRNGWWKINWDIYQPLICASFPWRAPCSHLWLWSLRLRPCCGGCGGCGPFGPGCCGPCPCGPCPCGPWNSEEDRWKTNLEIGLSEDRVCLKKICMYVCMSVCLSVCMYVRTYVRTYVCMYVCIYMNSIWKRDILINNEHWGDLSRKKIKQIMQAMAMAMGPNSKPTRWYPAVLLAIAAGCFRISRASSWVTCTKKHDWKQPACNYSYIMLYHVISCYIMLTTSL